jgi:REP element-mobilizing transposase RayT
MLIFELKHYKHPQMKHFRRRKPNRLKGFDYSSPNQYFVTINTKNKVEHFGLIKDKEMVLNELGQIVFQQWKWLEERYPYVKLHAFVVMPDHFHGIIQITNYVSKKLDNLDLNKNENGTSEKPIKIKLSIILIFWIIFNLKIFT